MTGKAGRRTSRRVSVSIPAGFAQTGHAQGVCKIVELSAGGCILGGTTLNPNGPEVFLHFRLGTERREIELRGRVAHVKEGIGSGVEFTSIDLEDRDRIRQYVEESAAEAARRHP